MEINVRPNDHFSYYSFLFSIPLQLIIQANKDLSPSKLQIGEAVNIPGYETIPYTVKKGETFWTISHREQMPLDRLLIVNQSIDPHELIAGQEISIPQIQTKKIIQVTEDDTYTSVRFMNDVAKLQKLYPFIEVNEIGKSEMGKQLIELRIGTGGRNIHYNGAVHANEWITSPVLMEFLNEYALALTTGKQLHGLEMLPYFEATSLSLVPMVNPDGVNLAIDGPPTEEPYRQTVIEINNGDLDFSQWKANIHGVDLNDQFPAEWEKEAARGAKQPAPRDYPGKRPLSESEAIALYELTGERQFEKVLSFHTQGEVIYWGFEHLEPPESEVIVEEFARVSGYEPIRYIESYAGFKDWFIQDFRRPGFTVELGRGVNPLPMSQYPEIYQRTIGIMLAGLYM